MLLLSDGFPVLVGIAPQRYDAAAVQRMAEAFTPYHLHGKRYAFICVQPPGSITPGAHERKLLMDWVASPEVQRRAGELCVGAATVFEGALMRGALTALLWFWKPPFPLETAATPEQGIRYCLRRLKETGVKLPEPPEVLMAKALAELEAALKEPQRLQRSG